MFTIWFQIGFWFLCSISIITVFMLERKLLILAVKSERTIVSKLNWLGVSWAHDLWLNILVLGIGCIFSQYVIVFLDFATQCLLLLEHELNHRLLAL